MPVAHVRLYAELHDRRAAAVVCPLAPGDRVRDLLVRCGVPIGNVDLILLNGESAAPSSPVEDGDRVSLYPVFESFDIAPVQRVRPRPLRRPRFVLDVHLGKLAALLRMFGIDALYRNDYSNEELITISERESRALLSRDHALLQNEKLTRSFLIVSPDPNAQLRDVIARFDLLGSLAPFSRCLRCNTVLTKVDKAVVGDALPAGSRSGFDEFRRCGSCFKVYWKGSHVARMAEYMDGIVRAMATPDAQDPYLPGTKRSF